MPSSFFVIVNRHRLKKSPTDWEVQQLGHLLLIVFIIIQSRGKSLKGSAFLHVIIMGIDLLRGKKIGMAEPFRDVFHRNSLVAEKSGAAMT